MAAEDAAEWYRFTCTRCSTWWITHYQVHRFTDDAGLLRVFYRHDGLPCTAPGHAQATCPTCGGTSMRAELLDHPATDTPPQQPAPGPQDLLSELAVTAQARRAGEPRHFRFSAIVSLDRPGQPQAAARAYPNGTHSLMVRARSLREPGQQRYFPAITVTDDGRPLSPGDSNVIVTIVVSDDDAPDFLSAGQPIALWDGSDIGHGTVSRRVFNWPETAGS